MKKVTFRELLQEYNMKRGWGFADVLLDREYVQVEECEHWFKSGSTRGKLMRKTKRNKLRR